MILAHIAHFEAGRRLPNVPNLFAMAQALGVSMDYLVGGKA
jgi:transcriptional regulator with XRE-family HTH domain